MTQSANEDINVFFNGYTNRSHKYSIRTKRLCYLVSLAARRCHSVFYFHGSSFINPLFFRFAMTSVDVINRKFKKVKKGIFLGNFIQSSGKMSFVDLGNIFPEAHMMDHPSGTDGEYRRNGKLSIKEN